MGFGTGAGGRGLSRGSQGFHSREGVSSRDQVGESLWSCGKDFCLVRQVCVQVLEGRTRGRLGV